LIQLDFVNRLFFFLYKLKCGYSESCVKLILSMSVSKKMVSYLRNLLI